MDDDDFDFEATIREIHLGLEALNNEAVVRAAKIAGNFEDLGV